MNNKQFVEKSERKFAPVLGFYAPVNAQVRNLARGDNSISNGASIFDVLSNQARIFTLQTLEDAELEHIDCILVDIRLNAKSVLEYCRKAARLRPVIVVSDADQIFTDDFPFGTYIADMTTPAELGSQIFWQRVKRAVRFYENPMSVNDTDSPIYSVFKSIADQASDWILVKDLQHRFLVAGEHFAATAGTPLDQIIGRDDLEIGSCETDVRGDPDAGKTGFWTQDDEVTQSGQLSVEENPDWLLYSESARHRRTYRVPLKNPSNDVFALLVCSQDITEQMSNARLLAERTVMLAQVTEEKRRAETNRQIAEDAVAAKTRFLAATSHDLRQPLHAMGLFLHSLDKRIEGREERHLVSQIKNSCASLSTLFNSCLDISRLDAGVVERKLEHFRVSEFLEGLNEEFRQLANEKGLGYRLTVDSSIIHSDQVLLSRIMRNLLSNALRNTEDGYLAIECRNIGTNVELCVVDSGCGIESHELKAIFDEYHQINADDARYGRGLGLGLAIVKRLCELLDICITVDSQPGEGARFVLHIPAGKALQKHSDDASDPLSLPYGLLVLIVEDDQNIQHGMQVLLESYGCQTLCAADSNEAIQMLENTVNIPDIIVADYHLSRDSTGIQAIRELHAHIKKRVPALLVTGDTSTDSEREAADEKLRILYKPVSSEALIEAIDSEVQRSGLTEDDTDHLDLA